MNASDNALPAMANTIEHELRGFAGKLKRVLFGVVMTGWSLAWTSVALVGYALGHAGTTYTALGVLGGTAVTLLVQRSGKRRRLKRLAAVSLLARAELEGLKLDAETESVLGLFDLAYKNVHAQLDDPDFRHAELGLTVATDMDRAREHLYKLTEVEMSLHRDLRQIGELKTVGPVSAAADSTRQQIQTINQEANAIAADAQKVSERVNVVRKLMGAGDKVEETRDRLSEALVELETTASAYREIDDSTLEAAEKRIQQLRQQAGTSR